MCIHTYIVQTRMNKYRDLDAHINLYKHLHAKHMGVWFPRGSKSRRPRGFLRIRYLYYSQSNHFSPLIQNCLAMATSMSELSFKLSFKLFTDRYLVPPTETVGKLHVNRSSLRPSLLRQVLFSLLSMSLDCIHCHTTMRTGCYICSVSYLQPQDAT